MASAAGDHSGDWPAVLDRLARREDLDEDTAAATMDSVAAGRASPAQVAGLLMALRTKGETVDEVTGLVRSLRRHALRVDVDDRVVDTCGTGGDRSFTFNISTLAAVVAAGAGARVAKHGNRAASGRCGSADLLEDWGVAIELPPEAVARCIDQVGIGFCFAPAYHPAMRHVGPVRRELGVRTVFNFLGPLTNPAGARHQTVGVGDPAWAARMAQALARLGTRHALVFHGDDGLDELSTTGPSRVWEVRDGEVRESSLDPARLGIAPADPAALRCAQPADNRRIADEVLEGRAGAPRDIVLLATAAALVAADLVDDWQAGLQAAAGSIDSGSAADVLRRWVSLSQDELVAAG